MSLWDRYLAPGDLRLRQQQQSLQHEAKHLQQVATPASPPPPTRQKADPATRVRRQNALLYGGLAFTFLSLFVTRRTLLRKKLQLPPATAAGASKDAPSPPKVDGALEAAEALGIATLNVFSIAMAATGAAITYFEIADIEDMREQFRSAAGYDIHAGDSAADREIEAWVAEVLARKDGKGNLREGVVERLRELEQKTNEKT